MITEEHVTRKMAKTMVSIGWEIVAVHPPDGQGPFVIPKPFESAAIERSSYHPDIVALALQNNSVKLAIVECKVDKKDVKQDIDKLTQLAKNRDGLLYALYRCQLFEGGPKIGFDFEVISRVPTESLPIEFFVASKDETSSMMDLKPLNGFKITYFTFNEKDLLNF